MSREILKKPRFNAAIFTLFYLALFFMVFSVSLQTAMIFFATFTVVIILEPWARFAERSFRIKRSISLGIGLAVIFSGLTLLIVFLTTPVAKEASKFYNIVRDFFPSAEETEITSFEVNANIDTFLSEEEFLSKLSPEEVESLDLLSKDLKRYYSDIMDPITADSEDLNEDLALLEETLKNRSDYVVIISSSKQKNASYEEIHKIISNYLNPEAAELLSASVLDNAMVVHSQELWRNVVDYFMPKNIDPSTQRATYESVRNFLIQVQSSLMKFLPGILEKIPSFLTSTGLVLFFTIVGAIYLSYYFLTVKDFIPRFYPKKVRGIAISFLEDTYKNLERYVISVVVIALIVGVVVGIVVHSMGLKYSLLMGTWAAFTNLIPIVGVPLEFIPLFLLAVSTQDLVLVITLMIILVIVHASAFILFLVFMKGYNRINPVIIILMIVIAGQLWGLFGAIIAVPFAIVLKMTWMHFFSPMLEEEEQ
ncbi:putative permease [Mesotoga prima MesG1.Ag.4.2]|uniref:Putative permease n=1 Tax=Mesotoga prima MesG1.Ag.4.2 TaxID=660470 RepID=I2F3K1_9BACT|nr:AI-2E family transporter [Mesotoga prima]AFK06504.1 putative permease [Mesotoga prima MesG1.Ag.4.2]